jgi:Predicted oxidoreductases (related to aryl-alcohol dehydrogenases)
MNKLCLGTVQFGLKYGINNCLGKPTKEAVFSILDYAIKEGIQYIDTATAYGDAEKLLGEYQISNKNVKVISKLKPNMLDTINPNNIDCAIEENIKSSLKLMNLKKLDGFLLHTPEYIYNTKVMEKLQQCKRKGLIKNIGVSIYNEQHALDAVKSGIMDYIQIPYNIFDQRLDDTPFFDLAQKNKVHVFARSAFLQGLLLMEVDKIPSYLTKARTYLVEFHRIVKKYKISKLEAAFLFSYNHPGIDTVVFGVDTFYQLQEDLNICSKKIDFAQCRQELCTSFQNIDKSIIIPSLWAK